MEILAMSNAPCRYIKPRIHCIPYVAPRQSRTVSRKRSQKDRSRCRKGYGIGEPERRFGQSESQRKAIARSRGGRVANSASPAPLAPAGTRQVPSSCRQSGAAVQSRASSARRLCFHGRWGRGSCSSSSCASLPRPSATRSPRRPRRRRRLHLRPRRSGAPCRR